MTFDEAMEGLCRAEERYGYRADVLPGMLKRFGGVGAANRLLKRTAKWQYGFKKLREGDHLHISVENLVLFGEFRKLFSEETLEEARRRLDSAGFDPVEGARALAAELD